MYTDYHPVKKSSCFQRTFSKVEIGSVRGSIFTVIIGGLGSGLLSIPYAVQQSGLILGSVLLVACGILTIWFYIETAYLCELKSATNMNQLYERFYGTLGRVIIDIAIFITSIATMVAYLNLIVETILSLLISFGSIEKSQNQSLIPYISLLMLVIIWLPMAIPKQITYFRYVSLISILCTLFILTLVIAQTPQYLAEHEHDIIYWKSDINPMNCVCLFMYALDNQLSVPILFNELQNRSIRRIKKVLVRGYSTIIVLFLLLGFFGALSYQEKTPRLVTYRPYPWEDIYSDVYMIISRFIVIGYISVAYPIILATVKSQMFLYVNHVSKAYYWFSIIFPLVLVFTIAQLLPGTVVYFQIIGGILTIPITFLFPAFMYLQYHSYSFYTISLISAGIILTSTGVIATIDTILRQS